MRGYRLVDWLTQGYLGLIAVLILLFHGSGLPAWPSYVAAHAGGMAVAHCLIRLAERHKHPLVQMLRAFYPIIFYSFLYTETHHLDDLFRSRYLDGFVVDLDQRLFGAQLCRAMMQAHPQTWLAEVLYASYFSYYVMVLGVGLALYLLRRRHFWRYVAVLSFAFYVCYLVYILVPVMGPYGTSAGIVFHGELASVGPHVVPATVQAAFFYKVMGVVYILVEPEGGAAFPSSHVTVALIALWFTWTHFRRVRLAHLGVVILLCLSTVYCGYHYAVDVLAGIATAGVLGPVGLWMALRWDGERATDAVPRDDG